jgi:predicted dehydrogenase
MRSRGQRQDGTKSKSFTYQARAFLDEIAGLDRLPRQATFADGLRNMRVEEAIAKSAATGAAVTVSR